ncbi:uncharacterized protein LOC110933271 [Helianthus annuus]|uniref:uncharacterized protein LOC110933271 n=1 Tax=Helianthus annuus TaxID=4232 RepID=UPI000B908379|nr:uncharacterized protein LOC110933271 [Helianthus annuus]
MDLLRQEDEPFDYVGKYGTQTGLFSLKIHYNGQFGIKNQNLCYITGKVIYVDFMDTDMFCIHDVNDAMRLLGFSEDKVHHFYFVVPGSEIHSGLMSLSTDDDVRVMSEYVLQGSKVISLYVEHGLGIATEDVTVNNGKVDDPKNAQVDEDVTVNAGNVDDPKNAQVDEDVTVNAGNVDEPKNAQVDEEVTVNVDFDINDVENRTEKFSNEDVENILRQTVVDASFNELFSDHNTLGDVLKPYVRPAEQKEKGNENEKGNETEKGNENENGKETEKAKQSERVEHDNEDSGDEDIVDEENEVFEVEVDMSQFNDKFQAKHQMNNEKETDNATETSVDDTEHDPLEEEYLSNDSLGTSESEGELTIEKHRKKAFRRIRKQQEASKEKCAFYVGQTFGDNSQVKTLIRRHAIETRREIFFYRNDQERIRAHCKGRIPDFEMAQEKEGPSESQKDGPNESQKDGGRLTKDSMVKDGKLSRKWKTVTCGSCGGKGHNKRRCTGQGSTAAQSS